MRGVVVARLSRLKVSLSGLLRVGAAGNLAPAQVRGQERLGKNSSIWYDLLRVAETAVGQVTMVSGASDRNLGSELCASCLGYGGNMAMHTPCPSGLIKGMPKTHLEVAGGI